MGISFRVLAASASRPEFSSALVRSISSTARTMAPIKVGDALPSVDLFEGTPGNKVNLAEECKSGKHVIMGVPGAFTPTCSKTHLPGYVAKAEKLKAQGVGQIFCVSVNDPFVMAAWGENQGAEGKVRMLADTCGEFTKAMEVDLDVTAVLGNVRSKNALSAAPFVAPGALLYADRSPSALSPPNPPEDAPGPALGRDLASGLLCRLRVAGTISGGRWR